MQSQQKKDMSAAYHNQQPQRLQQAQQNRRISLPVFNLKDENSLNSGNDLTNVKDSGWLLKWRQWIVKKNNFIWIKLPGEIVGWMGESYAEVLASALCKDFKIDSHVDYYPCIVNYNNERILSCYSYDFCEPTKERLITIEELYNMKGQDSNCFGIEYYRPLLKFIEETTGLNYQHHIEDMLFIDYLICNYDRSYNNFGVLLDQTGVYRPAPIFDSGSSFNLDTAGEGEFYRESLYTDGRLPHPFKIPFEQQISLTRSNRQYKTDFQHFKTTYTWFAMNCSEKYNRYNIVNPLSTGQLQFIKTMVKKNYIAFQQYKRTA